MDSNTVCVRPPANITAGGRRARMVMGVAGVVVALWLAHVLADPSVDRLYRLSVGLPLFFGVLGLLQAHEKT